MPFRPGQSGNPSGGRPGSRHRQQLNGEFIAALLRDFRHGGPAAIAKVRKNQPAAYCKLLTLLCPRDVKVEHSRGVKAMSDEEIEQAIEFIQTMLAARAGEAAKVIEGTAEPAALPAPNGPSPEAALEATLEPTKRKPNRLMMEADTAIGPAGAQDEEVPTAHVIAPRIHFRLGPGGATGMAEDANGCAMLAG